MERKIKINCVTMRPESVSHNGALSSTEQVGQLLNLHSMLKPSEHYSWHPRRSVISLHLQMMTLESVAFILPEVMYIFLMSYVGFLNQILGLTCTWFCIQFTKKLEYIQKSGAGFLSTSLLK